MWLSKDEVRSMWNLGFDSGRIYGLKGANDEDTDPLFKKDMIRFKKYWKRPNKSLKNDAL